MHSKTFSNNTTLMKTNHVEANTCKSVKEIDSPEVIDSYALVKSLASKMCTALILSRTAPMLSPNSVLLSAQLQRLMREILPSLSKTIPQSKDFFFSSLSGKDSSARISRHDISKTNKKNTERPTN